MFSLPQRKAGATRPKNSDGAGTRDSRYERSVVFCPHCYALITAGDAWCPVCGADLHDWHPKSYAERLILALNHPLADVRMRAIIALGLRRERAAEQALVACALRHPHDVVAGLEIINSLGLLRDGAKAKRGLSRLIRMHPARLIKEAAQSALRNRSTS
jgi:HEAT repeats